MDLNSFFLFFHKLKIYLKLLFKNKKIMIILIVIRIEFLNGLISLNKKYDSLLTIIYVDGLLKKLIGEMYMIKQLNMYENEKLNISLYI